VEDFRAKFVELRYGGAYVSRIVSFILDVINIRKQSSTSNTSR
jgi:hypothetical protein